MDSEERAALYREQLAARRNARARQFIALAGNHGRREGLDAAWAPPLLAALESQGDPDPPDALEEAFVEVPREDIYISEIPDGLLL